MEYVERWLNFIAKNYEYFEDLAKNIDHMNMDSAYTGDRFDGDNLLEKKGKVEAYAVDGFSKAFE